MPAIHLDDGQGVTPLPALSSQALLSPPAPSCGALPRNPYAYYHVALCQSSQHPYYRVALCTGVTRGAGGCCRRQREVHAAARAGVGRARPGTRLALLLRGPAHPLLNPAAKRACVQACTNSSGTRAVTQGVLPDYLLQELCCCGCRGSAACQRQGGPHPRTLSLCSQSLDPFPPTARLSPTRHH